MNKEDINIGQKFREAFENYEVKPDAQIWQNISSELKPGAHLSGKNFSFKVVLYAALGSIVISLSILLFMFTDYDKNENKNRNTILTQNTVSVTRSVEPEHQQIKPQTAIESTKKSPTVIENKTSPIVQVIKTPENKEQNNTIQTSLEIIKSNHASCTKSIENEVKNIQYPTNNNGTYSNIIKDKNTGKPNLEKSSVDTGFSVVFGPDPTVCFGEEAILEVKEGNYNIQWENGSTSNKIKVKPMTNSEYMVTVTNNNGQSINHNFKVNIDVECTAIFIPNAFSPNGDGNNDILYAEGVGIKEFYMQILNRAGVIVFQTDDLTQGWDASNLKNSNSTEVFVYVIKYTDARNNRRVLKGQVTLIR